MKNILKKQIESLVQGLKYLFSANFFNEFFNKDSALKRENVYKLLMAFIFLGYLSTMFIIVDDFGVSGDEMNSHRQSQRVFKYFSEGDSAAYVNTPGYLNLYGLSGNVIAEYIAKAFSSDKLIKVRHSVNVVYAAIGVIYMGLIGIRIAGGLGGLISLLFIILTPRYFGHSFNNLLDLPFAVSYIVSIYYIIRFFDFWPRIKVKHVVGLILGISFAISNRAPGIMLYAYFFLYAGLFYVFDISKKEFWKIGKFKKDILRFLVWSIPIVIASYGLSLRIWPYGLENPIKAIPNVLEHFSSIPVYMTTIFNGVQDLSNTFPRTYAPVYLMIGIPLFCGIGFILYFILLIKKKRFFDLAVPFLVFTALFPVAYIVYKKAHLYSGMRHLLFIVPSIILVATAGWIKLIKVINGKKKLIPIALLTILMFLPLRHMIANHPNHYVYFNEIVGGMKGGYANYDMDYFYNSIKRGADWLKENEILENDTLVVITNSSYTGYFDDYPNVKMIYSRYYEKSKINWDYAIYSNVFISREQIIGENFPPKGTIHSINVDGYPVGIVVKRLSHEDKKGFDALKKRKLANAMKHFQNFLTLYPNNEEVLEGMSRAYIMQRNYNKSIAYADSSLASNPRQYGALLLKASALNTQKKYNEALKVSNQIIQLKKEFGEAHFQRGYALKNLNRPNEALKAFQKALSYKKKYYQAYLQIGEIFTNYKDYKKAISAYSEVLKIKKGDIFATSLSAKCHHLLKDNRKAEELLNAIPQQRQNQLEVVKTRCRIALSKNDLNTAGYYLQMARNINNNADLFIIRGLYALRTNNIALAKQHFSKAKELDATNREASELLKSIEKNAKKNGSSAQQKAKQPQSIMYQKAKPRKKNNPIRFPR